MGGAAAFLCVNYLRDAPGVPAAEWITVDGTCPECDGTGDVVEGSFYGDPFVAPCDTCRGEGTTAAGLVDRVVDVVVGPLPAEVTRVSDGWEVWPPDPPGHEHPNHPEGRPSRLYPSGGASWYPLAEGEVVGRARIVEAWPLRYGLYDGTADFLTPLDWVGDRPTGPAPDVDPLSLVFRDRVDTRTLHGVKRFGQDWSYGRVACRVVLVR